VLLIVDRDAQELVVQRAGREVARSAISTGKAGFETPAGQFRVLEKRVNHVSSLYRGASMPYMQRLTMDGIALHAGTVPGYPASRGCIRLPRAFARFLFSVTRPGTEVHVI
jgi:lipoprotein-anchoring transpeptidase ErfK/SrfK